MVAKQFFNLRVHQHNSALSIHHPYRVGSRFQQATELRFRTFSLGDSDA
jgi:hypothetical protein